MPEIKGSYSKGIRGGFDEARRFAMGFVRPGIPIVDADENMKEWIRWTMMRRAFDVLIGSASPNNGFRIQGDSTANDFVIQGGDGTLNGAGRMFVSGIGCFLLSDIRYKNAGATRDQKSIHPEIVFITGLSNDTLEDSSANYGVNELVGRVVTPDITQPGITFTVVSNTATSIVLSGNLMTAGIVVGAHYRIEMSTPSGSPRNDGVYIDAFIDEIDGTEDPTIRHALGPMITAQFFAESKQRIRVKQGDTIGLPGGLPLNYIDADGFEHFLIKVADISRTSGVAIIAPGDVTDQRATSGALTAFVRKIGDNMTGDLNMLGGSDILLAAGGLVDGRDVSVDGTKLDTITWSPAGIAAQLKLISWPVQGTNLAAVATNQVNVSTYLKTRNPGGTDTTKGVVTSPGVLDNAVIIRRTADQDQILGGTDGRQGVLGRLTHVPLSNTLIGSWTWTNAGFTVNGVGGIALTQIGVGDIVQGPDGIFYTVATVPTNNQFTTLEPFAGTTGAAPTPTIRRWLLTLRVNDEGTEGNYTPPAPVNISWYFNEVFDESDRPVQNPIFGIPSDQVAAEVPNSSTTQRGVVIFAADGAATADRAVQAIDVRLGTVKGKNGATVGTPKPQVEVVAGSGVTVVMDDTNPTFVKFTISNSAPGGGGPSAGSATPNADSGSGSAGAASAYSREDHVHPLSSNYRIRQTKSSFGGGSTDLTIVTGFTPRLALFIGDFSGGFCVGVAAGDGAGDQGYVLLNSGGGPEGGTGNIGRQPTGTTTWSVQTGGFTAVQVKATRTGTGTTGAGGILGVVIGDVF